MNTPMVVGIVVVALVVAGLYVYSTEAARAAVLSPGDRLGRGIGDIVSGGIGLATGGGR